MRLDRRELLGCAGIAGLAGGTLLGGSGAHAANLSQDAEAASDERLGEVAELAGKNRYPLRFDGSGFSGPAWERLVHAGRASHFFVIGEEHGVAENPKLAAALFRALVPAGYSKLAIEISPPMAAEIDRTVRQGGLDALRRRFADQTQWVAFYTLREEAELLAAARRAVAGDQPVLWGVDYEVGADRRLIQILKERSPSPKVSAAIGALERASAASWAKHVETGNPQFVYSFAGDPALVRAIRDAWPSPDPESLWVLDTLEATFEINKLWVAGDNYGSNQRRADLLRSNFLRHWLAAKARGDAPRVMLKFGAAHVVRGLNSNDAFDLGALVPELAAAERGASYHLLVLAGAGSQTAQFDPSAFTYRAARGQGYSRGMAPIVAQALPDSFTLIDLRPLRSLVRSANGGWHPELVRNVHGFDGVLLLSGSTPSMTL